MNKVEKLQVAAYTAQTVRRDPEVLRAMRIKVVGPDGNVVREIDGLTLHQGLRERAGIEFDVQEGRRPTHKTCPCGRLWTVPPRTGGRPRRIPGACPVCRSQAVCAGSDVPCPDQVKPNRSSFTPSAVRDRQGQPWRCHACSMRATQEKRTRSMTETRSTPTFRRASSEQAKAWHASLTPEQKQERSEKLKATCAKKVPTHCKHGHELTPENTVITSNGRRCLTCRQHARSTAPQRQAASMRATLDAVPAQTKSERAKRAWETRRARYTPEELAEQTKRMWEARHAAMPSAEVLAERAKRAWETRRARYGPSGGMLESTSEPAEVTSQEAESVELATPDEPEIRTA
jgi:hypothetical protein